MEKHILFVDEEPYLLKALQRTLRKMRDGWDIKYVENAPEALEILSREHVDLIVSEMRLTGMSGLELLSEVRERYPHVVRIVLSGYADRDVILKTVEIAHQYLSKPWDDETLKSTISRAFMMRDLLVNDSLRSLVSRIDSLPSLPMLYVEVVDELKSEDASIRKVGEIIAKDLGMTAKILQLVNSSFFGVSRHISNPEQAVSLLGLDLVKAIVLTVGAFSMFETLKFPDFSIEALGAHCLNTGSYSKGIGQAENVEKDAIENAFIAGLLHDIGKMLIAANLSDSFIDILKLKKEKKILFWEAEYEVLGATHAELGAYLLGLWGLPDPIIEVVALHHNPLNGRVDKLVPLTIVHAANALENLGDQILNAGVPIEGIDYEYMEKLNLTENLIKWQYVCEEQMQSKATE